MTIRQFVHCRRLFTGIEDALHRDQTLVVEHVEVHGRDRIRRAMNVERRPYDRNKVTDLSSPKWTELHTRERVAGRRSATPGDGATRTQPQPIETLS